MTDEITYLELVAKVRDPETTDEELLEYFTLEKGAGGFDIHAVINTETVKQTAADEELENAMQIGNGLARLRHRIRYFDSVKKFPDRPTIVAEGDSWFQFPLLIQETVDYLSQVYNVWSLGAAGDTLENMVHGAGIGHGAEFLTELRRMRSKADVFLFSGAGNDIIGEDPVTKLPMLESLLLSFNGDASDVEGHINHAELDRRLVMLETGYRRVVGLVRAERGLETLPIVFHGYDYPYPYPWGTNDPRNPRYADKDQWLGRAFAARNIHDDELRRNILIHMIDRLYDMLADVSGDSSTTGIWVVNCRGTLRELGDWNDEIHGTTPGFAGVGRAFHDVISKAIAARKVS
ncbi:hypothetical protein [uncultured Sulfitobacter sp.]|uniref:hypothetical protein n=1 Tax=uncultured Sulfitobacter sp. TaxID=191468 RepID=UPI00261072CA|nr:hypothetical protein [uncultured Sulfitobacter sp.]